MPPRRGLQRLGRRSRRRRRARSAPGATRGRRDRVADERNHLRRRDRPAVRATALPIFPVAPVTSTRIRPAYAIVDCRHAPLRKRARPRFWRAERVPAFDSAPGAPTTSPSRGRTHARCCGAGVLTAEELRGVSGGPRAVQRELERGNFQFERRRRGHPHGDRAPTDRDRRPARRQAAHRALAQRPGRDRPRAWSGSARTLRAVELLRAR